MVAATSRASEYRDLSAAISAAPQVLVGLGMHPECAGSIYVPYELEIFTECAFVAKWISEVGLDAPIADAVSDKFGAQPHLDAQLELFNRVLDIAGPDKTYSVHSRGAAAQTLKALESHQIDRVVLHDFTGADKEMQQAIAMGYYFSLHPTMLTSASGARLMAALPLERMLLETDGPYYLWQDHRIEPSDCSSFAERLQALWASIQPNLFVNSMRTSPQ